MFIHCFHIKYYYQYKVIDRVLALRVFISKYFNNLNAGEYKFLKFTTAVTNINLIKNKSVIKDKIKRYHHEFYIQK